MKDYIVDLRSDEFLRSVAETFLRENEADLSQPVDILALVKKSPINSVYGSKRLVFEQLDDKEMGDADGLTSFARDTVSIQIKKSVGESARIGAPRARMTIAHELAHSLLHRRLTLARRTVEFARPEYIEPARSAERQAKVCGAALLMPDSMLRSCSSPQDIVETCLVSLEAAAIQFKLMDGARSRRANAARMRALAQELRQNDTLPSTRIPFLSDLCSACGHATVMPVGCKFLCQNCDNVSDGFQNGD